MLSQILEILNLFLVILISNSSKGGKADCNQINHWKSLIITDNHWQSLAIFDNQQAIKTSAFPPWSLSSSTVSLSLEVIEKPILRVYFDVCSLVVDMNMCQQDRLLLGM